MTKAYLFFRSRRGRRRNAKQQFWNSKYEHWFWRFTNSFCSWTQWVAKIFLEIFFLSCIKSNFVIFCLQRKKILVKIFIENKTDMIDVKNNLGRTALYLTAEANGRIPFWTFKCWKYVQRMSSNHFCLFIFNLIN